MPIIEIGGSSAGILARKVENHDDLAAWVDEAIAREQMRYRQIWWQWLRNIMAFHGEDDRVITEDLRVQPRASPGDQKRLEDIYINFVMPNVRSTAAKLMQARPILECDPAGSDDDDILAAKAGDRLLKGEWLQQGLDDVDMRRMIWMLMTGTGGILSHFDRTKGEEVQPGIHQGQIVSVPTNMFKLFFEPNREDETHCRWMVYQETLPRDEIVEKYEESYFALTGRALELPLAVTTKTDDVADSFLEAAGIKGTGVNDSEFLPVSLLYHLPTKWYPDGRYAVVCSRKVLYEGPYPYPFLGRLPIVLFRETLCPWRIYGETSTTEVLNAQKRYNRLRNQEDEYHRDNLGSRTYVQEGTKVRMSALRSRKNLIIKYRGEKAPSREPGISVPGTILASIELARSEVQQSGLSDVSQAQNTSGLTSGRAILALQAQDDIRLSLTAQSAEIGYGRLGQNTLLIAKHYYTEARKYRMVGQANAGALFFFDRAELGNTTDVRCRAGTALPMNKLARQESVKEQLALGILGAPGSDEALTRARRMLGGGIADDIDDDVAADEYVSERENMIMSQGQMMPVSEVDHHLLHLKCHLRRAKAPGIRDNPELLAIFVHHKREHEMYLNPQNPTAQTPGQPMSEESLAPAQGMAPPTVATPGFQSEGPSQEVAPHITPEEMA